MVIVTHEMSFAAMWLTGPFSWIRADCGAGAGEKLIC
jgi:hypothetical protein